MDTNVGEIAALLAQALIRLHRHNGLDARNPESARRSYSLDMPCDQSDESCSHQQQPVN